jgi:hypothetical protein
MTDKKIPTESELADLKPDWFACLGPVQHWDLTETHRKLVAAKTLLEGLRGTNADIDLAHFNVRGAERDMVAFSVYAVNLEADLAKLRREYLLTRWRYANLIGDREAVRLIETRHPDVLEIPDSPSSEPSETMHKTQDETLEPDAAIADALDELGLSNLDEEAA